MYKHPLVYLLATRIDRLTYIPFAFTAFLFLLSLCYHAYPGHSAMIVAEAARLTPSVQPAHGLFSTLTRIIASCDILSLPVRLNLFSAFCGCLGATLFFRLLARTILIYAYDPYEDEGGAWPEDENAGEPAFHTVYNGIGDFNKHLLSLSIRVSLAATVLLTLTSPYWLAATHLNESIFNFVWMLIILTLFPYRDSSLSQVRFLLSLLLFTLGIFESVVFVLLFPVMVCMTFAFYMRSESRMLTLAHTLFGGFAGIIIAFYLRPLTPEGSSGTFLLDLERFLRAVTYHHADECCLLFAGKGWLISLCQTAIPAALILFGKNLMFDKWTGRTKIASILVIAVAIPPSLNLSVAPFALHQPVDYLPVFSAAMLVASMAFTFTAARLFFVPKIAPANFNKEVFLLEGEGPPPESNKPAILFICLLLFLALCTPLRSFPYVKSCKNPFADVLAHELLQTMGDRNWLITNGQLDSHLRIQAHLLKKPLRLVTLRQEVNQDEERELQRLIATEPVFDHLNRPRLLNALSIGTLRFAMEWLTSDTNASRRVVVFGTHELWTACQYRALPQGITFGGCPPEESADTSPLIEASLRLAQKMAPRLLPKDATACYVPERLSALLRLKMGYAVNELGVLLEGLSQPTEAFAAYQRATQIDPGNVSALLNAYALARAGNAKRSQADALRQRLRLLLQDRVQSLLGLQGLLLTYGTIHQKAFYQQEAETWLSRGAQVIASHKFLKSLDVSQQTGINTLIERAHYYTLSGRLEEVEACYQAVLGQDPNDFHALYGMTILMINRNDIPKAEHWLAKAAAAKNEKPVTLLYPAILIAIHKGEKAEAEKLLAHACQHYPEDERFWKLRAVYYLKQGEVLLVRHQILPEMTKALKNPDHYLIHTIRGLMLKQQGEAYYRDARISLLKGLSLNASMRDVWTTVLELDMQIGSIELIESDIHHLLTLEPDHAQANYMKGSIQLARGKLSSAEDFFRRSIERAPTAIACNDLAETLRRQKKLKEAKAFAHQALTLDPKLSQARATLADILAELEKE